MYDLCQSKYHVLNSSEWPFDARQSDQQQRIPVKTGITDNLSAPNLNPFKFHSNYWQLIYCNMNTLILVLPATLFATDLESLFVMTMFQTTAAD